jgi:general secretion pathway protein E
MYTKLLKIESGLANLTEEQLEAAREHAKKQGISLHKSIYSLGFVEEKAFLAAVAERADMEFLDLGDIEIASDLINAITAHVATHYDIVPVKLVENTLWLATSDPFNYQLKNEIELVLDNSHQVEFVLASSDAIKKAIRKSYGIGAATVEQMTNGQTMADSSSGKEDLKEEDHARDASVIKLVNQLLTDAISAGATDIHIEPYENELKAKYRVDGMLHNAGVPPTIRFFRDGLTSRVKIMSGLDIAEKRLPQDGRAQINVASQKFDLRISILPTRHGEAINIRILPQSKLISDLTTLGMPGMEAQKLIKLIDLPHGIILVTGPTGSGKTTTLYTCMHMLKDTARKIITIEDPVEYDMNGIVQMQTHSEIGLTFARALRSMLRHDPDIMLVGEIRDLETAETAIRTALTGHLVFSTLHTNDAASAITRLLDMGIEPFLAASSIDAILAQRLVRVICQHCKEPYQPEPHLAATMKVLGLDGTATLYHGKGCSKCHFTGFHGRTVITELLLLSEKIREMTILRKHSNEIHSQARREGMTSLFQSGLTKIKQGITTYEEVLRVTKGDASID